MSNNNPVLVKQIREIVKGEYDYWATYNDPVKDGRKIKFMRNGYMMVQSELTTIKDNIVAELDARKIKFKTAGWETCTSWRGDYQAFIIRI